MHDEKRLTRKEMCLLLLAEVPEGLSAWDVAEKAGKRYGSMMDKHSALGHLNDLAFRDLVRRERDDGGVRPRWRFQLLPAAKDLVAQAAEKAARLKVGTVVAGRSR